MKINFPKLLILICFIFLSSSTVFSQVKNNFEVRYEADIRGEITFIANNVVNRQQNASSETFWQWNWTTWSWEEVTVNTPAVSPNDPYNDTGNSSEYNDDLNMQYIDVDTDNTTFSSSSATLDVPDEGCSLVRYAGLYWSAVYVNSDRSDIDEIKFSIPGEPYQVITADEILFDGDGDTDFGYYSPYACYKDVTSIVAGATDPDGDYTVANVRASLGSGISGGISGGWTMVVVYENPNLPGSKYITTFDGYAGIASAAPSVDIPISGFTTLPAPFNVNANIGVGALEGDNRIYGDGLEINANGSFSRINNTINPNNPGGGDPRFDPNINFFNSTLSIDDVMLTARNPNSVNTLGWDVDIVDIRNSGNNVIPNDATSAILRLSSAQDKYDLFFASFDVEIIAPNIVLEKKVFLPGGSTDAENITGQGVNLGQNLDYVLSFQNIGNDHATGTDPSHPDYQPGDSPFYTIRDVLPLNVSPPNGRTDFIPSDFVLPPGMSQPTYDPATRTLLFEVPNALVEKDGPEYDIRISVQVAENCFDFINACSNEILNLAYSTYRGVENDALVTDDPSVTDFDSCGFVVPGATNFLLDDLSACDFFRSVELCGASVDLDAGDGFDGYDWYLDVNEDHLIDSGDTLINSGGPNNDILTVTQVGTYIVDKADTDPCKGFQEIIQVVPYGSGLIPNPVTEYFNSVNNDSDPSNDLAGEIVQCSIDNAELPKLFLCGINDTRLVQVNILEYQSITWEQLDEASCDPVGDNCANRNLTCTWNQVETGDNYQIENAGKYRLQVIYNNGCTTSFYFNVFQNTLDLETAKQDIVCSTLGNITVTNPTAGYGYRLVDDATGSVLVPFSTNNSFDFGPGENGGYRVEVTQLDPSNQPIADACIFSTNLISIFERDFQTAVTETPATCIAQGTINIQVTGVDPDYEYEIRLDDGSPAPPPPANDPYYGQHPGGTLVDNQVAEPSNNFTFSGLSPGDYFAIAKTTDGCIHVESVTIIDNDDLDLTARVDQSILCGNGIIEMEPSGGQPNYAYAIWTFVDEGGTTVTSYPDVLSIDPNQYQSNTDFNITVPGDYTFVVVDENNCSHFSNTVTITEPTVAYTTSFTDETCFGLEDGSISVNITNSGGYTFSYLLTYPDTTSTTNNSGVFTNLPQGDYTLAIVQSSGPAFCQTDELFTIGGPTSTITADAILMQDYTCLPGGTATIQAQNVMGGIAPYEFSIDGVNFFSGVGADTFTGLTDGTYTITVRDAGLCPVTTNSITIDPLNEPSDLSFVSSSPNCPALTSDVTVTVVDGNTPFVFDIIAPAAIAATSITGSSADFDGLTPNTYKFRVTDNKGCSYTEDYTIAPINQITVNSQLDNNISCFGLSDGAGTFNVSNFITSYDYSVTGPATFSGTAETSNTIPLTGLAAGTYAITVTDNGTNCIATSNVTIAAPPAALTISNLTVTDLSCSTSGTVPGSVTITAIDGWGSYEYELEDPAGGTVGPQSTASFTGLTDTSGAYTVTVRDAGECEVTDTFTLNPTVAPVLEVTANSLCYDSAAGLTLTANITSGGEAPFQYRLSGGVAYQSNADFTGLAPGSYTVEVIDNKNCTGSASIDVFPTLTASASLVKDLDCSATPDAEINIVIAGGNPTFTYEVFRGVTSVQASTAVPSIPFSYFTTTAGTYEFVITDSESCDITTNTVVVSANTPPTVVEVITEPLCNTSADGIAELQISGGLPPYQIVFDGSAPSSQTTYPGLVDGTYNYTVTDSKGCMVSDSITLTAPAVIAPGTIDLIQDYRCDNTSATIQAINYSGGTPGYVFSIDGVNFQGSDTFNTGITAGTYTITIRDANNCTEQTPAIVIDALDPPTDITFVQTSPTCPAITADVTLTVVDGTAPFNYEIIAPAGSVINNGSSNVFTALDPGTYTFYVRDDKGCEIQRDYTVTDINRVDVVAQLTNNVSCFGAADGAFSFTVSDFASTYSYTVENSSSTVLQFQNNINTTTAIAVTSLVAETYTVTITDDTTNCSATTTMVIENPPSALDFTFTNTDVTCAANSTITVTPIGGWGSYEYQLENTVGPALVYPYQADNDFADVPAGSYTIYIRDAGNCIVSKPIIIDPAETPTIAVDATSDYCFDGTDQASLVITITDGVAPFTYSIDGGGQTAVVGNPFIIPNLIPDSYNIQVMDAYGCVSNILAETIASQLTASAIVTKPLDCTASPNATIDVTISNGYPPYASYEVSTDGGTSWSATTAIVGSTFSYSAASANTYDFRITDAQNCTVITQAIIDPIVNPQATAVVTDVACFGGSDGSVIINVNPNFGTSPYTISFDGSAFATTTSYSGLVAGVYPFIVRDSKSCEFTGNATVNEPVQILSSMMARDVTCNNVAGGGNILGGVDVTITQGGIANFTYTLYDSSNAIVVLGSGDPNPAVSASTTHSFDGVDFGEYYVRIVDANGCESDLGSVRVRSNPYLSLTANIPPPDCPTGGTAVITATGGSGDYTFEIYDLGIPPTSEISTGPTTEEATFTGLNPGQTYTIQAVDNVNLCFSYQEVVIPSLSGITVVVDDTTDISCANDDDGTMTFTVSNYDAGVTSIDYDIFDALTNLPVTGPGTYTGTLGPGPAGGPQSLTVNQIPPGDYVLLVDEATAPSCSNTTTFRITEPTPVALSLISQSPANCNVDAEVTVRASGGTGPYTYAYVIDGAAAPGVFPESATFTLDPALSLVWDVYAQDANGCISPLADVTITVIPDPEITLATTNQCAADEGGFSVQITLDVAGIAPHTISLDGASPQAATGLNIDGDTMIINNLSSGPHTIAIIDANGCADTDPITIYPPVNILANVTAEETCVPANAGEVTVTANGGSGTFTYTQITPAGPTNGTGVFAGLTHSVAYTFEVEDATTTCTETVSVTLTDPSDPTFTLSKSDVSCFGGSDGSITVTLNAGNTDIPYLYSLDGGITTQTSNVFLGRPQGLHNVTVVSDKGCSATLPITIDEPVALDAMVTNVVEFSCDAVSGSVNTASFTVTADATTGIGPYFFSIDGSPFLIGTGVDSNIYTHTTSVDGTFTIDVEDNNRCAMTQFSHTIDPLNTMSLSIINIVPIDCSNNLETMTVDVTGSSGTPPVNLSYQLLPNGAPQANGNFSFTTPGNYTIRVTDTDTSCFEDITHTVHPYELLAVTASLVTNAMCSDSSDGQLQIDVSGYIGAFAYQVLDNTGANVVGASGNDNAVTDPYNFVIPQTLPAGLYTVRVTETAFPQCSFVSNTVTIDAPEVMLVSEVSNTPANCNDDALVTVQAVGGTAGYTYAVLVDGSPAPSTAIEFTEDETLNLNPATSLLWDIYARDANGCISPVLDVTISLDTSPDITLTLDDECAAEGSFEINVSLDAVNFGVAPYTMSLDGNAFESVASFPHTYSGLSSGAHSVQIRDANGCTDIENITIDAEFLLSAIVFTQPTCATDDGVIEFTVIGGDASYSVALLNAGSLTDTGLVPVGTQFVGVGFGDYVVRVTDLPLTPASCTADAPISLEEPTPVTLLAPSPTHVSCEGASDGTITINLEPTSLGVNDNPPYTYVITDGTSTFTQNTNLFTGLTAGTWDITVTSNRNCVAIQQTAITEPIALDAVITNVTPFGCDVDNTPQSASIEVTITAGTGTADYFYSVNGGTFQPTGGNVFTHTVTASGNYDIIVRDANNCQVVIPTQVINPLNTFTTSIAQDVAITCDPSTPEQVTITVTDDGNPHVYTYELLPLGNPNGAQTATTGNTATFNLTAVGSYTFRITDTATGCYVDTAPYEIAPYDLIEVTATAVDPVICVGDDTGTFEIMVSGYSGGYSYEIFNADGSTTTLTGTGNTSTNQFLVPTGLSGGNYYVVVSETDPTSTLCSDNSNVFTIISPDMPLNVIVTPLANVTCDNDRGEILVDPSGGYPPYDIILTNTTTTDVYSANGVLSNIFVGLSAGNYTVTVTDSARTPGCVAGGAEVLIEPSQIVANAIPVNTLLNCFGENSATVSAVGVNFGSGNYLYKLNYYDPLDVNDPYNTTGAVLANTTGAQSSADFTDLGAGIYSITVSDGWNCDVETNLVTIEEPEQITASLIRTNPLTCEDGVEFELTAIGGRSGTYDYSPDGVSWLPMTSNPLALPETGTLGSGAHQYYVRDAVHTCDPALSNTITENPIPQLVLDVDPTSAIVYCFGDDSAAIYASATGGLGNYQYELYNNYTGSLADLNNLDPALLSPGDRIVGPSANDTFSNLGAGTYYVNVISDDCTASPKQVVIDSPLPLEFETEVVDVSCSGLENGIITINIVPGSEGAGGYIYAISPNLAQFHTDNVFDELAPGDYTILAQDQNGCFQYIEETIEAPNPLTATAAVTPETCAGDENGIIELTITGGTAPYSTRLSTEANFTEYLGPLTDMASGGYIIFVQDANGCEYDLGVTINPGVNLNATAEPVFECTGDSPDNYVNITFEDPDVMGDVLYALDSTDPNDLQLNPDFRNIVPGSHYIRVAHSNGCYIDIPLEIEGFEPLTLSLGQVNINEITATAQGGKENYTFYFDDINNGSDNTYRINRSDTYVVRVVDENGCEVTASIEMEFIDIEIPNFFTPDGDGLNDFWMPRNQEAFPEILTLIFDRYGREVYRLGLNDQGWDGLYNKNELPSGDYWYVIKLKGANDDREFVGHFTLYR